MSFDTLDKRFSKELNLVEFTRTNDASIRFLLIRSMDTPHLRSLCELEGVKFPGGRVSEVQRAVFDSSVSVATIVKHIRELYPEERKRRLEVEAGLEQLVHAFGTVKCGLRNDKVDDLVKVLVRDKGIKSRGDLEIAIEEKIVSKVRNYSLWSFYNQVTNDLIEHAVNDHPKVIPTLRKIPGLDFFLQLGPEIIPFDMKITHISDDFFDLYSQGLRRANGEDDYCLSEEGKSETWILKDTYKRKKREMKLGPVGGLSKEEIINSLLNHRQDEEVADTLRKVQKIRADTVRALASDLHSLEWWNYKFQGERLFKNNNRFFVFLAYRGKFEDARALKGEISGIRKLIGRRFDEATKAKINSVKYYYDKERQIEGAYEANAFSVLFTD